MRFDLDKLRTFADRLLEGLKRHERGSGEYKRRMHTDLSNATFQKQLRPVKRFVPAIPEIEHWFRRYVIVDLARILRAIDRSSAGSKYKRFFKIVFASIIRNSSNADPVPVSGLEVTAHMRRLDKKGREINPFALFRRALKRAVQAAQALNTVAPKGVRAKVIAGSAMKAHRAVKENVDSVITSPPYQGAVDYYRRHKLEMYWLELTKTEEERLKLLDKYVGRVTVPRRLLRQDNQQELGPLASQWAKRITFARATSIAIGSTSMPML